MGLTHALLRPQAVEERAYQVNIARECLKRATLVILPTGLGKTVVALLVIADRLLAAPGKILFLAPTKPLVEQHAGFLRSNLPSRTVACFTGEVTPEDRAKGWAGADVVVSTPQVVHNDLLAKRVGLEDVTLVVFDEAHRAVGDYAYPFIAEQYRLARADRLILGITASPGADPQRIKEVCDNLGIEGIEARTEEDPDVRAYVQPMAFEWVEVPLPEGLKRLSDALASILHERLDELRRARVYFARQVSKREVLEAQSRLQAALRSAATREERGPILRLLSMAAEVLKIHHGMELAETQGRAAVRAYLERLKEDTSKAAASILGDPRMRLVYDLARDTRVEHPKLRRVALIVERALREKPDARIIVFTHYRDTSALLTDELAKLPGVRPTRFVGQASRAEDKGMTQKVQGDAIRRFRAGELNVLVATSVAEEGLDIPSTDLVVFYEPVPSEIRSIQRRGRTARTRPGRVVVLVTKGTRDEAYYWTSKGKERRMRSEVSALRAVFGRVNESLVGFASLAGPAAPAGQAGPATSDESQTSIESYVVYEGSRAVPPSAAGRSTLEAPSAPRAKPAPPSALPGPPAPSAPEVRIIADHREYHSPVVRELARLGAAVEAAQLAVADFFLSDRVAVERKGGADLVKSLTEGRLFPQVKALAASVDVPILVLEGEPLEGAPLLRPEAFYGALASILADFRVPVLMTRDPAETARLLYAIARREQVDERRPVAVRGDKATLSRSGQQRFIVEGLPGVSTTLARRLLAHFGNVRGIFGAERDDLEKVDGIGREKAQRIQETLDAPYGEE